jgi:hypothetical protein
VFLHFDNLSGELKSNSQFDALFTHLLQNTQNALASYNRLRNVDRVRKTLVLVTLGASLHAVQDFYSPSDWIHNDFNRTPVRMVGLDGGGSRAPTWFEFRDNVGDPEQFEAPQSAAGQGTGGGDTDRDSALVRRRKMGRRQSAGGMGRVLPFYSRSHDSRRGEFFGFAARIGNYRLTANVLLPYALKFTGMFWNVHSQIPRAGNAGAGHRVHVGPL